MLYTLREECARDFEGTLRAVAAIGYEGVELFDLHGHEPAEVRALLDELGLDVAGRHAGLDALESDLPALAAELAHARHRPGRAQLDRPAGRRDADARAAVAPIAASRAARGRLGLRFGFHNHWGELERFDGGVTCSTLLRRCRPRALARARPRLGLGGRRRSGRAARARRAAAARSCT